MIYTFDRYWGVISSAGTQFPAYSGRGTGYNNPEDHDMAVGPLPTGNYVVDGPFNMGAKESWEHPKLGHGPVWHLVPDSPTREAIIAMERDPDSFFIHGDNIEENHSASEGCVITMLSYRDLFLKGDIFKSA